MKNSEVIETVRKFSKPYRIKDGVKFQLADIDPGDTGELKSEDRERAKEALQTGVQYSVGVAGRSLRARPLVAPDHLPGDGRGRKGRRHQTCHVRGQSAGVPGIVLQSADG